MSTVVKTYKNARRFQHDAPRMAARGFQVASTFQGSSRNRPLRNLMKVPVGGTLLWGASITGGKVVVTYQMAPQVNWMPQGAPMTAPLSRRSSRLGSYLVVTIAVLAVAFVLATALHPF